MKGQMVFEFLVAGMVFFAIVLYSLNFLNVQVSSFSSESKRDFMQSKTIRVSGMLMGADGTVGLAEDNEFNITRIREFNTTYCDPGDPETYEDLINDLYLYERGMYGRSAKNVKISLSKLTGESVLECGMEIPSGNFERSDMVRFGLLDGETAELRVVLW